MVIDQTTGYDVERITKQLKNFSAYTYRLNEPEIQGKLKNLAQLHKNSDSKLRQKLIDAAILYLEDLLYVIKQDKGYVALDWKMRGNELVTVPLRTKEFKYVGISYSDFIELPTNTTIVRLDFREILNLITFEIVYRDWGYSFEDMEEILKEHGYIGMHQPKVLEELINSSFFYETASTLRIGDCPYLDQETKEVYDYFGENLGVQSKYKPILRSTRNKLANIMVDHLLSKSRGLKMRGLKLISLTTSELCFVVTDASEKVDQLLDEQVTLRIFGRIYNVPLKITKLEVNSIEEETL